MKIKILCIIGTRPEAIKMAPVIKSLIERKESVQTCICVTGQHREMLDQALNIFNITADYDLNVIQPNQTLTGLTNLIMEKLDKFVLQWKPDWILAQGDTTTVFTSALVSFYHKIKFGHIESGLRSYNRYSPFPEEMNRILSDRLADVCFAPTLNAKNNLIHEGIQPDKIFITGNTIVDALHHIDNIEFDWSTSSLHFLQKDQSRIVLITAHRRENFGKKLKDICLAISELAYQTYHDNIKFIFPVHLNPKVKKTVQKHLSDIENVFLIPPVNYLTLVNLIKKSELILTDSGGIQEEAPSFAKPVLVLRDVTERPEGIEAGISKLVGSNKTKIVNETLNLLYNKHLYSKLQKCNPYGDGKSALRIVNHIITLGRK